MAHTAFSQSSGVARRRRSECPSSFSSRRFLSSILKVSRASNNHLFFFFSLRERKRDADRIPWVQTRKNKRREREREKSDSFKRKKKMAFLSGLWEDFGQGAKMLSDCMGTHLFLCAKINNKKFGHFSQKAMTALGPQVAIFPRSGGQSRRSFFFSSQDFSRSPQRRMSILYSSFYPLKKPRRKSS